MPGSVLSTQDTLLHGILMTTLQRGCSMFQMSNLRLREIEWLSSGHTDPTESKHSKPL